MVITAIRNIIASLDTFVCDSGSRILSKLHRNSSSAARELLGNCPELPPEKVGYTYRMNFELIKRYVLQYFCAILL